jgi:hypothetical protein
MVNITLMPSERLLMNVDNYRRDSCDQQLFGHSYGPEWRIQIVNFRSIESFHDVESVYQC